MAKRNDTTSSRHIKRLVFTFVGCCTLAACWSCFTARTPPPLSMSDGQNRAATTENNDVWGNRSTSDAAPDATSAAEGLAAQDARHKQLIIGEWEDDYRGKRYLTIREGGTATMLVEPAGIGKMLVAPQLNFDVEWSLEDGHLSLKTLGGEPKAKVDMVLRIYGNQVRQPIQELTAENLTLLDEDGTTFYHWRRRAATAEK